MTDNTSALSNYPLEFAYAVGKHVYFRYLDEADAGGEWHLWFNSPEVTRGLAAQHWVNTPEDQLAYLHQLRASRDRLALAVIDRESNRHIGIGSLSKIDFINRRAEMSLVIGSASHQDGFHALESLALLTELGLAKFNLNKLVATGLAISEGGLRLTKFLGYTETGRFREHAFVDGKYVDCIIMEMFQRDWLTSGRRPRSIAWGGPTAVE